MLPLRALYDRSLQHTVYESRLLGQPVDPCLGDSHIGQARWQGGEWVTGQSLAGHDSVVAIDQPQSHQLRFVAHSVSNLSLRCSVGKVVPSWALLVKLILMRPNKPPNESAARPVREVASMSTVERLEAENSFGGI